MDSLIAVISAVLFATGLYCLLQGHYIRIVAGAVLLSNAVNLLIFSMGPLKKSQPPLIPEAETTLYSTPTNPLAGAMILTSIVISLGMTAFLVALIMRSFAQSRSISLLSSNRPGDDT